MGGFFRITKSLDFKFVVPICCTHIVYRHTLDNCVGVQLLFVYSENSWHSFLLPILQINNIYSVFYDKNIELSLEVGVPRHIVRN